MTTPAAPAPHAETGDDPHPASAAEARHDAMVGALLEMNESARLTLTRFRLEPPAVQARAVVLEIARVMGGRYLPKGDDVTRAARDASIMADWRAGVPAPELAKAYHLTVVRIYQIVARMRAERAAALRAQAST